MSLQEFKWLKYTTVYRMEGVKYFLNMNEQNDIKSFQSLIHDCFPQS